MGLKIGRESACIWYGRCMGRSMFVGVAYVMYCTIRTRIKIKTLTSMIHPTSHLDKNS